MNNKVIIESMSMDLKRVALGLSRGSFTMANRFAQEAIKRKSEVDTSSIKPYLKKLLEKMEQSLKQDDKQKIAEDSLMFSTLFQNYTQKFI